MTSLATDLRDKLKDAVTAARDLAEAGSRAALEALAVHHHEPYGHMTMEERRLRRNLRAHARQLGDRQDQNSGIQAIGRLVTECAYEHWHRMLFARYLAETHLLIEPETGVAISLEECKELAREEGLDTWTLAGRYAEKMLPQIFRPDDPLLQVKLARNHQLPLEDILKKLSSDTFTASDSLGWVYQFWQTRRQEEVNASKNKIGADELPAKTQFFTEPYMVSFLIHNTLGAWRFGRLKAEGQKLEADSEQELRQALALPGVSWEYLRFVKDEEGAWTPAAGIFEQWPDRAGELKILDPCCGSGHFLVALFNHLVALRMAEEGLSARAAGDAVLVDNLHGLELDERCTQIAAFALALAAWQYPEAGGFRQLPQLPVACSGLSVGAAKEEWKLLGLDKKNLSMALGWMHDCFSQAPTLGSLLDPASGEGAALIRLGNLDWEDLSQALEEALAHEPDEKAHEAGVAAQGLARSARILAGRYHWVITNVPYLKAGYHGEVLKTYCEDQYPISKYDLATVFIERCHQLLQQGGALSVVSQQYWLFLKYYEDMRKSLLNNKCLALIARLGPGSFETISGEVVNICLQISIEQKPHFKYQSAGFELDHLKGVENKKNGLLKLSIIQVLQSAQRNNPNSRISFELEENLVGFLSKYADFGKGSVSGDGPHYLRKYWEIDTLYPGHQKWLNSPNDSNCWSGREHIILWGLENYDPQEEIGFRYHGQRVFLKKGIAIGKAGKLRYTPYGGELFDDNLAVICPYDDSLLENLWGYCTSGEFEKNIRMLDKKFSITAGTFTKVPFDQSKWSAFEVKNDIRKPYTDDPTQWIFHGHPCGSVVWREESKRLENGPLRNDETVLQTAVARLLGYRWPAELDPNMELAIEQRDWVKKCDTLLALADEDGIVPLPSLRGEDAAHERVREMLADAFGPDWSPARELELLAATGTQAVDLDDWLRNCFFESHCKLFQHRPFIWHIWDGRKRDGFHALVNYHKLAEGAGHGRQLLEKLTFGYLGDWIILQKDGVKQGSGGAEDRLAAALELEKRLKAILEGEPPFDIFVRWKSLSQQPVGWEPDINDGVRLNIRPFMADDIPGGKKGAGILRWKPNINWNKDRGKDVPSAPWYTLGPEYGGSRGDRINDHHLTLAEKRGAQKE